MHDSPTAPGVRPQYRHVERELNFSAVLEGALSVDALILLLRSGTLLRIDAGEVIDDYACGVGGLVTPTSERGYTLARDIFVRVSEITAFWPAVE